MTLASHDTVWRDLVEDAKRRDCFFNTDNDKDLKGAIWNAKQNYKLFDDLVNQKSRLFINSKWKVIKEFIF